MSRAIYDYYLFLDDFRNPRDVFHYTGDPIYNRLDWLVVRSYDEFVAAITHQFMNYRFPAIVSFDHDLADVHYEESRKSKNGEFDYANLNEDEKTGLHCAKMMCEFVIENDILIPKYYVHSQNPVGKDNISRYLDSFREHYNLNFVEQ